MNRGVTFVNQGAMGGTASLFWISCVTTCPWSQEASRRSPGDPLRRMIRFAPLQQKQCVAPAAGPLRYPPGDRRACRPRCRRWTTRHPRGTASLRIRWVYVNLWLIPLRCNGGRDTRGAAHRGECGRGVTPYCLQKKRHARMPGLCSQR